MAGTGLTRGREGAGWGWTPFSPHRRASGSGGGSQRVNGDLLQRPAGRRRPPREAMVAMGELQLQRWHGRASAALAVCVCVPRMCVCPSVIVCARVGSGAEEGH